LFFVYITAKGELPKYMGFFLTAGGKVVPDNAGTIASGQSLASLPLNAAQYAANYPTIGGSGTAPVSDIPSATDPFPSLGGGTPGTFGF
jgi:hypothetical protein